MSDLESFFGADKGGESVDPAAFEKFKERMAAAAAQLKALQAQEQKQKKKEDELVKILLKFIQTGQKRDIMLLVSRLLEQNVPAHFIVGVLLINNPQMQEELGVKLLPPPGIQTDAQENTNLPEYYLGDKVLPLKLKLAIDRWAQEILNRSEDNPQRVLATTIDGEGLIKLAVLQLANFCLRDFLEQEGLQLEYETLKDFIELMMEKILTKVHQDLKERKMIN